MSSMFSSKSSAFLQGNVTENTALLAFTWVWWGFVSVCQEIRLNYTENLAISLKTYGEYGVVLSIFYVLLCFVL